MNRRAEELRRSIDGFLTSIIANAPQSMSLATTAAGAALRLPEALRLGDFLGPVIIDAKPRLLLRFACGACRMLAAEEVVLKVYGDAPRGEGPLQAQWRRRGVPTLPVFHGTDGHASWLLMPHAVMRPVKPTNTAAWLKVTDAVAAHAPIMHAPVRELAPVLRPLARVMVPRLVDAVTTLGRAGLPVPTGWRERAQDVYGAPGVPLHGDLATANVAFDEHGELLVFDASALLGPLAFDAVRWAIRATSPMITPHRLLQRWAQHETIPAMGELADLMAVEALLEAGSRCAVAERKGSCIRLDQIDSLLHIASLLTAP